MMAAFRRPVYSSLTFRLADPGQFEQVRERIEDDRRLPLEAYREREYYAVQSRFTTQFITILGTAISIVFSLGAIVGAMITMYAAVANRTREIGTLRALGFSRFSILLSFLLESLLISVVGAAIALIAASFLELKTVSTVNFDTFSELVFGFHLTSGIVLSCLAFAVIMGVLGGFLPAVRASRLGIVSSLRAV
jgi:ABC-type antimicrobial peptide transport system permease subunit